MKAGKFSSQILFDMLLRKDPQNVSHAFNVDKRIKQFIQAMNNLTKVKDKQRDLMVVFHILKGFDGNFIIEELYRQAIKVENQLTTRAKTLKFNTGIARHI